MAPTTAPLASASPAPTAPAALSPTAARLTLAAVMAAAIAISLALGGHAPTPADPSLTRLLRAMAAIKLLIAALAGATLYWRLSLPAAPPRLAAYAAAAAAMAAGPGLIWNLNHIAAGALLLHAGLIATLLLLWRDPGMTQKLEQAIKARTSRPPASIQSHLP